MCNRSNPPQISPFLVPWKHLRQIPIVIGREPDQRLQSRQPSSPNSLADNTLDSDTSPNSSPLAAWAISDLNFSSGSARNLRPWNLNAIGAGGFIHSSRSGTRCNPANCSVTSATSTASSGLFPLTAPTPVTTGTSRDSTHPSANACTTTSAWPSRTGTMAHPTKGASCGNSTCLMRSTVRSPTNHSFAGVACLTFGSSRGSMG
ncbi:hypothetical protein BCR44DRAFT_1139458 [Catenaria anguillulae PL171]|uniref:Uncharacterized protein n=1 Tax=Catenaria anguillulae PL171 TaxID=765915 RepID=A0A1Y2HK80_9FUNG|nr:hypothetical protein BCR44DRAFT_1139458 [Catenaria anguillulae PL171]